MSRAPDLVRGVRVISRYVLLTQRRAGALLPTAALSHGRDGARRMVSVSELAGATPRHATLPARVYLAQSADKERVTSLLINARSENVMSQRKTHTF